MALQSLEMQGGVDVPAAMALTALAPGLSRLALHHDSYSLERLVTTDDRAAARLLTQLSLGHCRDLYPGVCRHTCAGLLAAAHGPAQPAADLWQVPGSLPSITPGHPNNTIIRCPSFCCAAFITNAPC